MRYEAVAESFWSVSDLASVGSVVRVTNVVCPGGSLEMTKLNRSFRLCIVLGHCTRT